jgi:hypothetical protein
MRSQERGTHPDPGAGQRLDGTSYQTLMTAQATLNSLKASAAGLPSIKPVLNQAISAYDIAETSWQAYHAAATTANQAAVTRSLANLNGSLTALQSAVAGAK